MDVRAKQRLSYQSCPLNSELRVIGFAPRHLNRSTAICIFQESAQPAENYCRYNTNRKCHRIQFSEAVCSVHNNPNAPSNNSMDVRAKQRSSFRWCLFYSYVLGGGFAPRHLNRSVLRGKLSYELAKIQRTFQMVEPNKRGCFACYCGFSQK